MNTKQSDLDTFAIQSARVSFASYMVVVHETDMPWIANGRAEPVEHMLPLIKKYEMVADIILRRAENWEQWAHHPKRHTSAVSPPDSAKTTLTQFFMEWLLGQASLEWGKRWAERFHMAFVSASEGQANRISVPIMSIIKDSAVYHAIFPAVRPDLDHWAKSEWRVKGNAGEKDPTFQAQGRRGDITGSRLNFLALDDLIKQEEIKSGDMSPKEIMEINRWIRMTALRRLVPTGCAWGNHTRWLEGDCAGWMEENGWDTILVTGLNEKDESFWESRHPSAKLIAEREADPEAFALQYQGLASPKEGIEFKAEYFEDSYDQLPVHDRSRKETTYWQVQSIDPAGTKNKRSDFTANITAIIDVTTAEVFITGLFHAKLEFYEVLEMVRGQNMHTPSHFILLEQKGGGLELASMLYNENPDIARHIVPLQPFGQKGQMKLEDALQRIVKPFCREKNVHFPSQDFAMRYQMDWLQLFMHDLLAYPRTVHDDIARAFIQLIYWVAILRAKGDLGGRKLAELPPGRWVTPRGRKWEKVRV